MSAITPEQVRAGRGWLGWTQDDLAKRASVGLSTVRDFENGKRMPIPNNLAALQRALEDAGIGLQFAETGEARGITGKVPPNPPSVITPPPRSRAERPGMRSGAGVRGRHDKPNRR